MLELPASTDLDVIKRIRPEYVQNLEGKFWSRLLLQALARHSFYTYKHSLRVGYLSGRLFEEFEERENADVLLEVRAGTFHDIGKLIIPQFILNTQNIKPWQRKFLNIQPTMGFIMLSLLDNDAAQTMVTHHQFQDRCYPGKKLRDDGSRRFKNRMFVALADQDDALLMERPYKPAWPAHRVVAELERHFDVAHIETAIQLHSVFTGSE